MEYSKFDRLKVSVSSVKWEPQGEGLPSGGTYYFPFPTLVENMAFEENPDTGDWTCDEEALRGLVKTAIEDGHDAEAVSFGMAFTPEKA